MMRNFIVKLTLSQWQKFGHLIGWLEAELDRTGFKKKSLALWLISLKYTFRIRMLTN